MPIQRQQTGLPPAASEEDAGRKSTPWWQFSRPVLSVEEEASVPSKEKSCCCTIS